MSDAYDALMELSDDEIAAYSSNVNDENEAHIVIGKDRFITVPEPLKRIAVQHDHDIETVTFDCPRYWDNHDMSEMVVYINYRLADGTTDSYPADNVVADGDIMHFDWTISRNVSKVVGRVAFLVCVKKTTIDDIEVNHWNSELCADLYVSEGLECSLLPIEQYPDIVNQLLTRMNSVEQVRPLADQAVAAARNYSVSASRSATAAETALSNAEQAMSKSEEAAETASKAALEATMAAADQVRTKATAVVLTGEGDSIVLTDSSNDLIRDFRIMGKTTQAASPTPDNPQELVNIESVTCTVNGKNFFDVDRINDTDLITKLPDGTISVSHYYAPTTMKLRDLAPGMVAGKTYTIDLDTEGNPFVYLNNCSKLWNHGIPMLITEDELNSPVTLYGKTEQTSGSTIIRSIQVRLFNMDKAYEKYRETGIITCSKTLRGIPVSVNGNYTDSNGQQWYCDEVDFERGVYIQRCCLETLAFTPQTELSRYSTTLTHRANPAVAIDNGIPVLCENLPFDPMAGSGTPQVSGIRIATTSPKYAIAAYNGQVIGTETILYPLETPIETPLTSDELAAYKALHTNYPNTVILNGDGVHVIVDYNADTKTYIDNHITSTISSVLEDIMNGSY